MKLVSLFVLFLFKILVFNLYSKELVNELNNILYNQGELSDQIICCFKNLPTMMYYPSLENPNNINKNLKQISFFVPFVTIKDKCKEIIKNLEKNLEKDNFEYKINFECVTKPLAGIKVTVIYNPKSIFLEYGLSNIDKNSIFFRVYNKKMLNLINEKTCPLRWYANSIHKPKVILDNIELCSTKKLNLYNFSSQVKSLLSKSGFDVYLFRSNNGFENYCNKISHANLVIKPDVFVSFLLSRDKSQDFKLTVCPLVSNFGISNFANSKNNFKNNFNLCLNNKSKILSEKISDKNYLFNNFDSRILNFSGLEMPAVMIKFNCLKKLLLTKSLDLQNNLAQVVCSGIISYIADQNNTFIDEKNISGYKFKFNNITNKANLSWI